MLSFATTDADSQLEITLPSQTVKSILETLVVLIQDYSAERIIRSTGNTDLTLHFLRKIMAYITSTPDDLELEHFASFHGTQEVRNLPSPLKEHTLANIGTQAFSFMLHPRSRTFDLWVNKVQKNAFALVKMDTPLTGKILNSNKIFAKLLRLFDELEKADHFVYEALTNLKILAIKTLEKENLNGMDKIAIANTLGPCLFNFIFQRGDLIPQNMNDKKAKLFALFNHLFLCNTWPENQINDGTAPLSAASAASPDIAITTVFRGFSFSHPSLTASDAAILSEQPIADHAGSSNDLHALSEQDIFALIRNGEHQKLKAYFMSNRFRKAKINELKHLFGRSLLHFAILHGKNEIADLLIKLGANVAAKDDTGTTPLHLAVQKQNLYCIQILLACERGKQTIEAQNTAGQTPLHIHMLSQNNDDVIYLNILNTLTEAGASYDTQDFSQPPMTPRKLFLNRR